MTIFAFKQKTHEEVVNIINDKIPIKLNNNEDLVTRVHNRYPMVSKAEVALVVKSAFEVIRDCIILGKTINLHSIIVGMSLSFSFIKNKNKRKKRKTHVVMKLMTPKHLRTNNE